MSKKYVVEFTEKQIETVARGLEFYSRFLGGQWEIPDAMEFKEFENQEKYDGFWEKRNYVEGQLSVLKAHFTGLNINASYGIGSKNIALDAQIAYDIYRPILEEVAKISKYSNVYSYPGLTYSDEGRIMVEVMEK